MYISLPAHTFVFLLNTLQSHKSFHCGGAKREVLLCPWARPILCTAPQNALSQTTCKRSEDHPPYKKCINMPDFKMLIIYFRLSSRTLSQLSMSFRYTELGYSNIRLVFGCVYVVLSIFDYILDVCVVNVLR